MHNLRHFYYQNKEKIWKVVLIITFLLGMIYYINYLLIKNEGTTNNKLERNEKSVYGNIQDKNYISEEAAISGSKVAEEEVRRINSTISKFLGYCKQGNTQEAYNMLSKDCKETEYNTINQFQERYIDVKFGEYDAFEIQKWINNTYKITICKDILSTGDLNINNQIEYITIVKEDELDKLNINGYIGNKKINKEKTIKQIKVKVISKKVYLDYEEYNFQVENLSNKTIKLDLLEKPGTMYLRAESKSRFNAYVHEIYDQDIEIKSKHESIIDIKYSKPYSSETNIKEVVFDKVIVDYHFYKDTLDEVDSQETCQIIIEI